MSWISDRKADNMDKVHRKKLISCFSEYITDHKKGLIDQVLTFRTRQITIALEDIYHPQNASAVVRTCDCFGIQDLHVIENKNKYTLNPKVVLGASKWIDLIFHNDEGGSNTLSCINQLKAKGYKILCTSPDKDKKSIHDVEVDRKLALLFGTELTGLSEGAMCHADEVVHIPMVGFTESYNLSVSVAICLCILTQKLYYSDLRWQLSEAEKEALKLAWYRNVVPKPEILEKEFLKQIDGTFEKDRKSD